MARLCVILASPIRYNPYNFSNKLILFQRYQFLTGTNVGDSNIPDTNSLTDIISISNFNSSNEIVQPTNETGQVPVNIPGTDSITDITILSNTISNLPDTTSRLTRLTDRLPFL